MQLVRPAQEDGSMSEFNAYVGLDVHKDSISVAIAEAGRDGEVRHWGVIRNTPEAVARLARKLVERHRAVEFAYEAGPCGYTLYRHLTASGLACHVVRNGHAPERQIQTGIGPLEVRRPRVRDRGAAAEAPIR